MYSAQLSSNPLLYSCARNAQHRQEPDGAAIPNATLKSASSNTANPIIPVRVVRRAEAFLRLRTHAFDRYQAAVMEDG